MLKNYNYELINNWFIVVLVYYYSCSNICNLFLDFPFLFSNFVAFVILLDFIYHSFRSLLFQF